MKLSDLTYSKHRLTPHSQRTLEALDDLFSELKIDLKPMTCDRDDYMCILGDAIVRVRELYHDNLPDDSPEREAYKRAMQYERVGYEIDVLRHRYEQVKAEVADTEKLTDPELESIFNVMLEIRKMRKHLGYTDERLEALWEEIQAFLGLPEEPQPTNDSLEEH